MTDNITLPRATVQQALEALEYASTGNRRPEIIGPAITALRTALEQQAEPVAGNTDCVFPEWKPGDSDFKHWCLQHFGSDADEKYLAEAVLMLPRKQKLPMKAADEFELHRLLAEERHTVRQLSRALREQVESPTFMGEPLITHPAPTQQQAEPVAWMVVNDAGEDELWWHNGSGNGKPLYTAQPQRKPLTDEMRKQMKEASDSIEMRGAFANGWLSAEAAHGIKEGT